MIITTLTDENAALIATNKQLTEETKDLKDAREDSQVLETETSEVIHHGGREDADDPVKEKGDG